MEDRRLKQSESLTQRTYPGSLYGMGRSWQVVRSKNDDDEINNEVDQQNLVT